MFGCSILYDTISADRDPLSVGRSGGLHEVAHEMEEEGKEGRREGGSASSLRSLFLFLSLTIEEFITAEVSVLVRRNRAPPTWICSVVNASKEGFCGSKRLSL